MHVCAHANPDDPSACQGGAPDASLEYARLRLDLLRLARQLTEKSAAEEVVQAVMRQVVRRGPDAPRDARGLPRPAYLASLVHAFIAENHPAPAPVPALIPVVTLNPAAAPTLPSL